MTTHGDETDNWPTQTDPDTHKEKQRLEAMYKELGNEQKFQRALSELYGTRGRARSSLRSQYALDVIQSLPEEEKTEFILNHIKKTGGSSPFFGEDIRFLESLDPSKRPGFALAMDTLGFANKLKIARQEICPIQLLELDSLRQTWKL